MKIEKKTGGTRARTDTYHKHSWEEGNQKRTREGVCWPGTTIFVL